MASNKTYSLWFRPFGDVGFELKEQIKELSKRYKTPSFQPHVTLLTGLDEHETELIQLTETLAHSLNPFTIFLEKGDIDDQYFHSLYIKIRKTEPLMAAHRIARELFDVDEHDGYSPHLSLLYGNQTNKEKNALLNIMGRSFNMQFDVHSVLLIKTGDDVNNWEKIHNAEFKKHHLDDVF